MPRYNYRIFKTTEINGKYYQDVLYLSYPTGEHIRSDNKEAILERLRLTRTEGERAIKVLDDGSDFELVFKGNKYDGNKYLFTLVKDIFTGESDGEVIGESSYFDKTFNTGEYNEKPWNINGPGEIKRDYTKLPLDVRPKNMDIVSYQNYQYITAEAGSNLLWYNNKKPYLINPFLVNESDTSGIEEMEERDVFRGLDIQTIGLEDQDRNTDIDLSIDSLPLSKTRMNDLGNYFLLPMCQSLFRSIRDNDTDFSLKVQTINGVFTEDIIDSNTMFPQFLTGDTNMKWLELFTFPYIEADNINIDMLDVVYFLIDSQFIKYDNEEFAGSIHCLLFNNFLINFNNEQLNEFCTRSYPESALDTFKLTLIRTFRTLLTYVADYLIVTGSGDGDATYAGNLKIKSYLEDMIQIPVDNYIINDYLPYTQGPMGDHVLEKMKMQSIFTKINQSTGYLTYAPQYGFKSGDNIAFERWYQNGMSGFPIDITKMYKFNKLLGGGKSGALLFDVDANFINTLKLTFLADSGRGLKTIREESEYNIFSSGISSLFSQLGSEDLPQKIMYIVMGAWMLDTISDENEDTRERAKLFFANLINNMFAVLGYVSGFLGAGFIKKILLIVDSGLESLVTAMKELVAYFKSTAEQMKDKNCSQYNFFFQPKNRFKCSMMWNFLLSFFSLIESALESSLTFIRAWAKNIVPSMVGIFSNISAFITWCLSYLWSFKGSIEVFVGKTPGTDKLSDWIKAQKDAFNISGSMNFFNIPLIQRTFSEKFDINLSADNTLGIATTWFLMFNSMLLIIYIIKTSQGKISTSLKDYFTVDVAKNINIVNFLDEELSPFLNDYYNSNGIIKYYSSYKDVRTKNEIFNLMSLSGLDSGFPKLFSIYRCIFPYKAYDSIMEARRATNFDPLDFSSKFLPWLVKGPRLLTKPVSFIFAQMWIQALEFGIRALEISLKKSSGLEGIAGLSVIGMKTAIIALKAVKMFSQLCQLHYQVTIQYTTFFTIMEKIFYTSIPIGQSLPLSFFSSFLIGWVIVCGGVTQLIGPKSYARSTKETRTFLETGIGARAERGCAVHISKADGIPLAQFITEYIQQLNFIQYSNISIVINTMIEILRLIKKASYVIRNFQHYDLHVDNIFIDPTSFIVRSVRIPGERVIEHKYISYKVTIIDFDLAYAGYKDTDKNQQKVLNKARKFKEKLFIPRVSIELLSRQFFNNFKDSYEYVSYFNNIRNTDLRNWSVIINCCLSMILSETVFKPYIFLKSETIDGSINDIILLDSKLKTILTSPTNRDETYITPSILRQFKVLLDIGLPEEIPYCNIDDISTETVCAVNLTPAIDSSSITKIFSNYLYPILSNSLQDSELNEFFETNPDILFNNEIINNFIYKVFTLNLLEDYSITLNIELNSKLLRNKLATKAILNTLVKPIEYNYRTEIDLDKYISPLTEIIGNKLKFAIPNFFSFIGSTAPIIRNFWGDQIPTRNDTTGVHIAIGSRFILFLKGNFNIEHSKLGNDYEFNVNQVGNNTYMYLHVSNIPIREENSPVQMSNKFTSTDYWNRWYKKDTKFLTIPLQNFYFKTETNKDSKIQTKIIKFSILSAFWTTRNILSPKKLFLLIFKFLESINKVVIDNINNLTFFYDISFNQISGEYKIIIRNKDYVPEFSSFFKSFQGGDFMKTTSNIVSSSVEYAFTKSFIENDALKTDRQLTAEKMADEYDKVFTKSKSIDLNKTIGDFLLATLSFSKNLQIVSNTDNKSSNIPIIGIQVGFDINSTQSEIYNQLKDNIYIKSLIEADTPFIINLFQNISDTVDFTVQKLFFQDTKQYSKFIKKCNKSSIPCKQFIYFLNTNNKKPIFTQYKNVINLRNKISTISYGELDRYIRENIPDPLRTEKSTFIFSYDNILWYYYKPPPGVDIRPSINYIGSITYRETRDNIDIIYYLKNMFNFRYHLDPNDNLRSFKTRLEQRYVRDDILDNILYALFFSSLVKERRYFDENIDLTTSQLVYQPRSFTLGTGLKYIGIISIAFSSYYFTPTSPRIDAPLEDTTDINIVTNQINEVVSNWNYFKNVENPGRAELESNITEIIQPFYGNNTGYIYSQEEVVDSENNLDFAIKSLEAAQKALKDDPSDREKQKNLDAATNKVVTAQANFGIASNISTTIEPYLIEEQQEALNYYQEVQELTYQTSERKVSIDTIYVLQQNLEKDLDILEEDTEKRVKQQNAKIKTQLKDTKNFAFDTPFKLSKPLNDDIEIVSTKDYNLQARFIDNDNLNPQEVVTQYTVENISQLAYDYRFLNEENMLGYMRGGYYYQKFLGPGDKVITSFSFNTDFWGGAEFVKKCENYIDNPENSERFAENLIRRIYENPTLYGLKPEDKNNDNNAFYRLTDLIKDKDGNLKPKSEWGSTTLVIKGLLWGEYTFQPKSWSDMARDIKAISGLSRKSAFSRWGHTFYTEDYINKVERPVIKQCHLVKADANTLSKDMTTLTGKNVDSIKKTFNEIEQITKVLDETQDPSTQKTEIAKATGVKAQILSKTLLDVLRKYPSRKIDMCEIDGSGCKEDQINLLTTEELEELHKQDFELLMKNLQRGASSESTSTAQFLVDKTTNPESNGILNGYIIKQGIQDIPVLPEFKRTVALKTLDNLFLNVKDTTLKDKIRSMIEDGMKDNPDLDPIDVIKDAFSKLHSIVSTYYYNHAYIDGVNYRASIVSVDAIVTKILEILHKNFRRSEITTEALNSINLDIDPKSIITLYSTAAISNEVAVSFLENANLQNFLIFYTKVFTKNRNILSAVDTGIRAISSMVKTTGIYRVFFTPWDTKLLLAEKTFTAIETTTDAVSGLISGGTFDASTDFPTQGIYIPENIKSSSQTQTFIRDLFIQIAKYDPWPGLANEASTSSVRELEQVTSIFSHVRYSLLALSVAIIAIGSLIKQSIDLAFDKTYKDKVIAKTRNLDTRYLGRTMKLLEKRAEITNFEKRLKDTQKLRITSINILSTDINDNLELVNDIVKKSNENLARRSNKLRRKEKKRRQKSRKSKSISRDTYTSLETAQRNLNDVSATIDNLKLKLQTCMENINGPTDDININTILQRVQDMVRETEETITTQNINITESYIEYLTDNLEPDSALTIVDNWVELLEEYTARAEEADVDIIGDDDDDERVILFGADAIMADGDYD